MREELLLSLSSPSWAGEGESFRIDTKYPGGNAIVESIDGDTVHLRPDLRDTEGWWFYWNFKVAGAAGRTLTFHFGGRNPIGARGPAVSSDDGATWSWLGADKVKGAAFSYAFPADGGSVQFAFTVPYQEANLRKFLAKHKRPGILAVETLCKSAKGRNVEGPPRRVSGRGSHAIGVLITARHHACEAMASLRP